MKKIVDNLNMDKLFGAFFLFILVSIVFMGIGFSAYQNDLLVGDISGVVRAVAIIRVTGSTASSTNDGYTTYDEYDVDSIESNIVLPSTSSIVTYRVYITNFGSQDMALTNITGVPSNMEIKNLTTLQNNVYGVKLCNGNRCNNGAQTYVDVTLGWKSNVSNGSNTPVEIHLDFTFKKVFSISYSGFTSNSGLATEIVESSSKNIVFSSSNPVPGTVVVSGASGTYASGTLTLSNPSDNVNVTRAYNINYVDFTGTTTGLISYMTSSGGTITFNNTSGIPGSVTVTGASGTYNSPNLIISNITGDVTITAVSSGNVTVIDNGDGTSTTITENVVDNGDGSETTTTVVVNHDANGDVTSSSQTTLTTENTSGTTTTNSTTTNYDSTGATVSSSTTTTTTNNSNGSGTSTTINYDGNGNPTSGSTSNTDTSGNTNTQSVEYDENGDSHVNGYTIDTTGNASGGETINNSNVDTGMIVFDGSGFEMNLTFKTTITSNAGNNIFGIIQPGTQNNKYSGFVFSVKSAPSNGVAQLIMYAGTNANFFKNTGAIGSVLHKSNKYWGVTNANAKKVTEYTVYLKYLPANYGENQTNQASIYMTFSPIATCSYCNTSPLTTSDVQIGYIPTSLPNATFTLGGNGIHSDTNMLNFEVVSFDVHKI